MNNAVIGAKGGGGKSRSPKIANDTAASKTFARLLYGMSEGEVEDLANGLNSIYLDDTPLEDENGNKNFEDVTLGFRTGTNDQDHIEGFEDVVSEVAVGVELKSSNPWVKGITNTQLDAVIIRLRWGALKQQDPENGDVSGVTIEYAIDVQTDGGAWEAMLETKVSDKTSDKYERTHRIGLPRADGGWQIRVRRITPNSTSEYVSDKMYVQAIAEVVDLKLAYPNTALLGIQYNAETFSNIAKVAVDLKGIKIKVPSNYDPMSRTYVGIWNGLFKRAYSNNPAWIYYDLCTAKRYGLGNRLTEQMIDKWSLYRLGQYCDQMVPDGKGGEEPRFTCNVYIQSAEDAFSILSKLAGVFRAISFWDGQSIVCDADLPQDTFFTYTHANVIEGHFEYGGTRARDRHTVVKVAWDNPKNRYKTEYVYVRDEKAIGKLGVRILDLEAWGCTSEGQAQRAGQWALKSEQLEIRTVTFKVGLDGHIPQPGRVIEVADPLLAGRANGGRIAAVSKDRKSITIDRDDVICRAGDRLVVNGEDGKAQARIVAKAEGRVITVIAPFDSVTAQNIWVVDAKDLATMKFRVMSITQNEDHQFTITGVQYNSAKYDAIDHGAHIDDRPISIINPNAQKPVESVSISADYMVQQGATIATMVIAWPQAENATKYQVEWRKDDGSWIKMPITGNNSIEVSGIYSGNYEARVVAISAFDIASLPTYSKVTELKGKIGEPPKVAFLRAIGVLFGMKLEWGFPETGALDTAYTEIRVSPDGESNIGQLGLFAYPTTTHTIQGLQANLTQFYSARLVDKIGNVGEWSDWVSGTTTAEANEILDLLDGQISETQLDKDLRKEITLNSDNAKQAQKSADEAKKAANDATQLANKAASDAKTANTNALNAHNAVIAESKNRTDAINQNMAKVRDEFNQSINEASDGFSKNILEVKNDQTQLRKDVGTYKLSNDGRVAAIQKTAETSLSETRTTAQNVNAMSVTLNTKNRTYRQASAPTANLIVGDLWINTIAGRNNEIRRWNGSTWDDTTDPRTASNVTAINAVKIDVNNLNNQQTQHASSILKLENEVTVVKKDLDSKASNSALQAVSSDLKVIDGKVTSNTNATTQLKSDLTETNNKLSKKVDSAVLVDYYTKTQANQAIAGGIQAYDSSLIIGGTNLLFGTFDGEFEGWIAGNTAFWTDENPTKLVRVNQRLELNTLGLTTAASYRKTSIIKGRTYTLSFIGQGTFSSLDYCYLMTEGGQPNVRLPNIPFGSGGQTKRSISFVAEENYQNVGILIAAMNVPKNGWFTIRSVQLEEGTKATEWSENPLEVKEQLDLNAKATSELSARTKVSEGKIESQSTQITNLQNSLATTNKNVATKAESSALNATNSSLTAIDGRVKANTESNLALTGRISTVEGDIKKKADASVLNNYYTKTESNQATASQIQDYSASLQLGGKGINLLSQSIVNGSPGEISYPNMKHEYVESVVSTEIKAVLMTITTQATTSTSRYIFFANRYTTYNLQISAGGRYIVSVWVTASEDLLLGARLRLDDGTYRSGNSVTLKAAERTRLSWVITIPASFKGDKANLSIWGGNDVPAYGGTILFDGLMLEEAISSTAILPSEYSVPPSANADAKIISSTQAKVSEVDGVVKSHNQQLSKLTADAVILDEKVEKKANASALNNYYTKAESDNAISRSTTALEASTDTKISNIDSLKVIDTRNTDELPQWYWKNYGKRSVTELKLGKFIGSPLGLDSFGYLETTVPWGDASGGVIVQSFTVGYTNVAQRNSVGSDTAATWSEWRSIAADIAKDLAANANAIKDTKAEVVKVDGRVTAQSNEMVKLTGRVKGVEDGVAKKADATALNNYYTKTQSNEVIAGQIKDFEAQLTLGGSNLLWGTHTPKDSLVNYGISTNVISLIESSPVPVLKVSATADGLLGMTTKGGYRKTKLVAGKTYTLSFEGQSTFANWNYCYLMSSNGNYSLGSISGGSGLNIRRSKTFVAPRNDDTWGILIAASNTKVGDWFEIRGIQVEEGNISSAWSANSEEITNDLVGKAKLINETTAEVSRINGEVLAQTKQVNTMQTTVNGHTSSIQSQQQTVNGLSAKATLQVEAGGTVGGVALGNDKGVVDFIVRANKFAIAPPVGNGNAGKYTFVYQSTSQTLPNGTVIPPGLYLDNAVFGRLDASKIWVNELSAISSSFGTLKAKSANIEDAAITNAKIKDAAIDTAKIRDLSVDTLKIKDQAVTVSVAAQNTRTLSIWTSGGQVRCNISVEFDFTTNYSGVVRLQVFRSGVFLREYLLLPTGSASIPSSSEAGGVDTTYTYTYCTELPMIVDRPPTGGHVYTIAIQDLAPPNLITSIALMEVKK